MRAKVGPGGDMAKTRTSRRGRFLDAYNPADAYLQRPANKRGAPGVLDGSSPDGDPLLIRVWPRDSKTDDRDLVEIWRNELRLLHRLGGAPGAEEHIARLLDAGEDEKGFYIVIAAGQRRPLAVLLERGRTGADWLRLTSSPTNRRRLWANLRRIVVGLEILHSQGLIHCNLDIWSVLTTGDLEPDFQLTGFEWSMRLMSAADAKGRKSDAGDRTLSFRDDWKAFARLAANLMNIKLDRLADLRIPHYEVAEHVTADEIWLLRDLLLPPTHVQLDGAWVTRRIETLMEALEGSAAAEDPQYQLVLSVGRESSLSRAIRDVSDLAIELDDTAAQLDFIAADLAHPRAIAVGRVEDFQLMLRGVELVYRLRRYTLPKAETPTWEFAVCERADRADAFTGRILSDDLLPAGAIRFMTFGEANGRAPRMRGRVLSWETVRARLGSTAPQPLSREQRVLRALTLLHVVDLVSTTAEAFSVTATAQPATDEASEPSNLIEIKLEPDPDRHQLSEALGLRSAADRLRQLLERDIADDEGWRLSEDRTLGRRGLTDIDLEFERIEGSGASTRFIFRSLSAEPFVPRTAVLVPGEFRGRISQFQRRAAALRALESHTELLRMLADPRGGLTDSHERAVEDDALRRLDSAKQEAFRELAAVLPVYLVQGPPGVGKTYLVREVVRRRFAEESTARLLLTAQSHHAVDHLMSQIRKDWIGALPLAVRCRATEDSETSDEFDLRVRSRRVLTEFSESPLAQASSEKLRDRLRSLVTPATATRGRDSESRLVEGLVMRSANVVFATTNSGDLERLLEEKGQFDWAVVEEAGKATGLELLIPLLLSYRRLMIGDHKQLPPFGSEKLESLLATPETLAPALKLGLPLVQRALRDVVPEDLVALLETEESDSFERLCGEARRVLFLFESLVETEAKRLSAPAARGRPIARKLDIQHRMHPDIAELVSKSFYGDLRTSEDAEAEFRRATCPVTSVNPLITPRASIVVVDMPYERTDRGGRAGESFPRYSNHDEVRAVRRVVADLRTASREGRSPSLAILSPYARQVARMQHELLEDSAAVSALASFHPVARHDAWCSTVDAFQGNEADAVIISLVRNNHHANPRSALGFVSDARRMNVLLSRAKWRLYLVTSLEFLRTVTSPLGGEENEETAFLRTMLTTLDGYFETGQAVRLDGADLIGAVR